MVQPTRPFTSSELETLYQIVRNYQEGANNEDDEYYDNQEEEPIQKKVIASLLKKIGKQLPEKAKKDIEKDFLRQKYDTYNNNVDQGVYSTLKNAFGTKNTVEISYFNMESAEFTERKIDVYYTSGKYTIAYCHLRKEIRKFRTSRIASTKITTDTYEIPNDFNKKEY